MPTKKFCVPCHRHVQYHGEHRLQSESIATVRVRTALSSPAALTCHEQEDQLSIRSWTVQDILASDERFFPRSLTTHLTAFLAGAGVRDAFETWP